MTAGASATELERVGPDTAPSTIVNIVVRDGGVILSGFFSPDLVRRFNEEIDPPLELLAAGRPTRSTSSKASMARTPSG